MEKSKKAGRYSRIYDQIKGLLEPGFSPTACMSTIVAVLHHKMDYFFWTGFYMLDKGELIVGSYQGPVACIKLKKDTGVCWAGINQQKTLLVPDVHKFPGHIACDSRSNSEIVVPLRNSDGVIVGILDIDSTKLNSFDEIDAEWLEKIIGLINI